MKKSGNLNDFGDNVFVTNYNKTISTDTQKLQKITNIGYIAGRLELMYNLVRRLQLVDYIKRNPSIKSIPIRAPVFVTGMPRSGTTFLHRLLSLDPSVRAPFLWELMSPIPRTTSNSSIDLNNDREIRIKWARNVIERRRKLGDHALIHIHEVNSDLPEECIVTLADEVPVNLMLFYSSYMNADLFFKDMDMKRAYERHKEYLQVLSAQTGESLNPRRWMLKCPMHLWFMKDLLNVFPDAQIIWTHRHPINAVTSMCSLMRAIHQMYYEPEGRDDVALGQKIKEISEKGFTECSEFLKKTSMPCVHTIYNDLIANPIECIKNIYKELGWQFTKEYETILLDYIAEDKKKRSNIKKSKGEHLYKPEEFGLTEEILSTGIFNDYIKTYNLPMSR